MNVSLFPILPLPMVMTSEAEPIRSGALREELREVGSYGGVY